jgi:hypothetical protein
VPDSAVLTTVLQSAGAGTALIVVLLLLGLLVTGRANDRTEREADGWKAAYDSERAAHEKTRDMLAVANQRAEAAVETARITKELLSYVQQQRGTNGPDPQAPAAISRP